MLRFSSVSQQLPSIPCMQYLANFGYVGVSGVNVGIYTYISYMECLGLVNKATFPYPNAANARVQDLNSTRQIPNHPWDWNSYLHLQ